MSVFLCYNQFKKGGGFIKNFCFTVDDNIRFLKEIGENDCASLFDHPYLAMYRRFHEEFGLRVQLNLFYRMEGFDLSQMSDRYYEEWRQNSHWLKLSFHSELENVRPYENAAYGEVYEHCRRVHEQIVRFASPEALADTTTIHYCKLTQGGLQAMEDNGVSGLLGLFGTEEKPTTSYEIGEEDAERIRHGEFLTRGRMTFAAIDVVLNVFSTEEILQKLAAMSPRSTLCVMIHEQFFYSDYKRYQPEFEDKLRKTFMFLCDHGYQSQFFEYLMSRKTTKI